MQTPDRNQCWHTVEEKSHASFDWMRARLSVKWANKRTKDEYLSLTVMLMCLSLRRNEIKWIERAQPEPKQKKVRMKEMKKTWPIEKRVWRCVCCVCRDHCQQSSWCDNLTRSCQNIFIYWWIVGVCWLRHPAPSLYFSVDCRTHTQHREVTELWQRNFVSNRRIFLFCFVVNRHTHFMRATQRSKNHSHCHAGS